jgi:hypothetical protein
MAKVKYTHDEMLTLIAETINDLTPEQAVGIYRAIFSEDKIKMRLTRNDAIYTVITKGK